MLCRLLGLPMTSHLSVFPLCSRKKSLTFKDTVRCPCGILGNPRIDAHMNCDIFVSRSLPIHPEVHVHLSSCSCLYQSHIVTYRVIPFKQYRPFLSYLIFECKKHMAPKALVHRKQGNSILNVRRTHVYIATDRKPVSKQII